MFQTFKPEASATEGRLKTVSSSTTNSANGNGNAPIRVGEVNQPTTTFTPQLNEADEEMMNVWLEKAENISKNDPDWMDMSSDALVATVFATQCFVQSITRDSLLLSSLSQSQSIQPPQEPTLNYNDIARCVSLENQYAFLSDMIPRTKNLNDLVRENKIRYTTYVNADQLQDVNTNKDDTEDA